MDCDRAFFAHLLAFLGVGFCMLARKHLFDVYRVVKVMVAVGQLCALCSTTGCTIVCIYFSVWMGELLKAIFVFIV